MARFTDSLRQIWSGWDAAGRLVAINIAVFILLHIFGAANILTGDRSLETAVLRFVELPASPEALLRAPWTIVTYMFSQYEIFHLMFNILWLWWFGKFFLDARSGRSLLRLYLGGGILGGLCFIFAANMIPGIGSGAALIGSSASVLAIVTATALIMPNRTIRLFLIGDVRLKWLAIIMIAIDLLNGGNAAHIGGILVGAAYWYASTRTTLFSGRPRFRIRRPAKTSPVGTAPLTDQDKLDLLLDKIRRSGYSSLTPAERDTLFRISNRIKP
ncbi:MAG: rhomboid family intramembrane serine protease [Clostridium sp.]|nr:rhomboid family intramembrane serine protease [Clostridium sp.]